MTSSNESNTPVPIHPAVLRTQEVAALTTKLCSEGNLAALCKHIDQNPGYVRIGSDSHAALLAAVRGRHLDVCLFLNQNYSQEVNGQCVQSIIDACTARDCSTVKMLLDPRFHYSSYNIMFILQIAGENGDEELIDYIITERAADYSFRYILTAAAICGVLRSGKSTVLASLLQKLAIGNEPTVNKKLYRGMLVRAAQMADPETFLEVLKTVDCKFRHRATSNSSYIAFSHVFASMNKTGALYTITDLCCSNPSNVLIDALIGMFGSQMYVDDKHRPCLENACRYGHTDAVRFFTSKYAFSDIPGLVTIARVNSQAAVLALFYFKYGSDLVLGAEPEHKDRINQLLGQHFAVLSNQFSPGSTPGGP